MFEIGQPVVTPDGTGIVAEIRAVYESKDVYLPAVRVALKGRLAWFLAQVVERI